MADFDLTQTDAQVQSILNDGQNMQGAGAQTTLTTESVLLKDVNGNYHKILKSSFTEAIRDTLAGLLVNNDKGTTINQIAAIASGDFGSITPANLASVLGGLLSSQTLMRKVFETDENTYTDYDDFVRGGVFYSGDAFTISHCPVEILTSTSPQACCINIGNAYFSRGFQIAFSNIGIGIRFRYSNTSFSNWSYMKYNE